MQTPIKSASEFSLWTEKIINKASDVTVGALIRTVVAVDPAVSNTQSSDEHGIIVASAFAGGDDDKYSILADYTRHGSPLDWANAVIFAVDRHDADAVVIEVNQGGDMCENTLRNAGYQGRVIRYHAKRGKVLRAEPVAALYERQLVHHCSGLTALENEMLDFDIVTQTSNGKSPNRIDAMVYAIGELSGIGLELGKLLKMSIKR